MTRLRSTSREALAGWNNGLAKLNKGGWIEFYWQDPNGAKHLFQLVRR